MIEQVTHIRLKNSEKRGTEKILEVLLASGDIRPISAMIKFLEIGERYFYFNTLGRVTYIEPVHPLYKESYIRSCDYDAISDDLLELPRF